ncbi:MAG: carbohydrate kinase family protein [Spirochaetota bacterium]
MPSTLHSKPVIVIGASNIDIKGKSYNSLIISDSNPSNIKMTVGGVGRNIAENLIRLNVNTILLSSVGNDFQGNKIIKSLTEAGLDTSHMIISDKYQTGTYIAVLDYNGEMHTALSSMDINNTIDINYINEKKDIISNAKYIVLDTNLNTEVIEHIIKLAQFYNIPVCVEPVSTSKAKKLRNLLYGISLITPNTAELDALIPDNKMFLKTEDKAQYLLNKGLKNIVLTMGRDGAFLFSENARIKEKSIQTEINDVTGAGDSFMAGLIYGLYNDYEWSRTLKYATALASLTIKSHNTVYEELNVNLPDKLLD